MVKNKATSMKLTINDIANRCGVGKSTVSRVLNNDPNVSQRTREKIQAVIDELGFQPNPIARAMRGAEDPVVGIIVTRLNSTAESQTLSTILQQLYAHNITPIIVESQFQPEQVSKHFQLFQQRQVSGVILFGFSELPLSIVRQWQGAIVSLARAYPDVSGVYYDDENAVRTLLNELYQQGHRHIAYLGVNDEDETTGRKRNQTYLKFCEEQQMPPNLATAQLSAESGCEQTAILFKQEVSAILCASTSLAIGALKYMQHSGQKRPLACIGKNELLQHFAPDLLSLDFGYPQAGKIAVNLLLKQFNGDLVVEKYQVPFKLA